ncbi:MAG TPA: TOBE domain-containing protein, partial [Ktedonobacterales bacterium]
IQQLGSPQELYDRPANLFVAGFIGSPAMDFFDGTIKRTSEGATATIGSRTLILAGQSAAAASNAASSGERQVIIGVRPEDFHLAAEGDANTLLGTIDVVEHLGNEQLIYMQSEGLHTTEHAEVKGLTARIGPDAILSHGEKVAVACDPTRVHLFDADSTKRL